ncbi:hypothetical protein ABK040_014702 [Willaertia magna]
MSNNNKPNEKTSNTFEQLWKEFVFKATNLILNYRINWPIDIHKEERGQWFQIRVQEIEDVNKQLEKILKQSKSQQQIYIDVFAEEISHSSSKKTKKYLLERWKLECFDESKSISTKTLNQKQLEELNFNLPIAYRKSIVLMRSLFSYLLLLPSFKLFQRLQKHRNGMGFTLKYYLSNVEPGSFESSSSIRSFDFSTIEVSTLCKIKLSVKYRKQTEIIELQKSHSKSVIRESQIDVDYFSENKSNRPNNELFNNVLELERKRAVSLPPQKMAEVLKLNKNSASNNEDLMMNKMMSTSLTKQGNFSLLGNNEQQQQPTGILIHGMKRHNSNNQVVFEEDENTITFKPSTVPAKPMNIPQSTSLGNMLSGSNRHERSQSVKQQSKPTATINTYNNENTTTIGSYNSNASGSVTSKFLSDTPPFSSSQPISFSPSTSYGMQRNASSGNLSNVNNNQRSNNEIVGSLPTNYSGMSNNNHQVSPPFSNNLELSGSWKSKNFKLSFSPLNDCPLNSYTPPSLLSESLKSGTSFTSPHLERNDHVPSFLQGYAGSRRNSGIGSSIGSRGGLEDEESFGLKKKTSSSSLSNRDIGFEDLPNSLEEPHFNLDFIPGLLEDINSNQQQREDENFDKHFHNLSDEMDHLPHHKRNVFQDDDSYPFVGSVEEYIFAEDDNEHQVSNFLNHISKAPKQLNSSKMVTVNASSLSSQKQGNSSVMKSSTTMDSLFRDLDKLKQFEKELQKDVNRL